MLFSSKVKYLTESCDLVKQRQRYCFRICSVSFKDVVLLSKEAQLSFTPFLWTYAPLLSKKPSCPLFGQEYHLFERKASLVKKKIESAVLLFETHKISVHICSTPFNHTNSLNICNTPFKETQLPSIWTGKPFVWRRGFTHHKENCTFPKASHLKGKLHIPREYLRMFSIQYFFDYGLWRMHLIDTWCLRGQMNQIWLRDQILEENQQNQNKNNQKKEFWVTYFGMGGGGKALQCICFLCFLFFCLYLCFFLADGR